MHWSKIMHFFSSCYFKHPCVVHIEMYLKAFIQGFCIKTERARRAFTQNK